MTEEAEPKPWTVAIETLGGTFIKVAAFPDRDEAIEEAQLFWEIGYCAKVHYPSGKVAHRILREDHHN